MRKQRNIYCFDSSAFIALGNTDKNIIKIPDSLWDYLEKMMSNGTIISHKLVYSELTSSSKKPDFIAVWIADKDVYFFEKTFVQIALIPQIIKNFPDLIDYQREREQADPWLVALAMEKAQEQNLFYDNISIVITQENPNSSKKIPAACRHFKISHKSLREFFDEVGVKTRLSKN